jgi:hypothetical protein
MTPVELHDARVPGFIRFTAQDYRELARGARCIAQQAERDALAQENPGIRKLFNDTAKRNRELAEKCELAAKVL